MLDALRNFLRRIGADDGEGDRHYSEDDSRLALAALLVHCTRIDGAVTDNERQVLHDLISRNFGLAEADCALLIADAQAAEHDAVDLYRFTSVLKRTMSADQRIRVVENLWEIVYADARSHEFEENLWRVAELLGVDSRDRVASKLAVRGSS